MYQLMNYRRKRHRHQQVACIVNGWDDYKSGQFPWNGKSLSIGGYYDCERLGGLRKLSAPGCSTFAPQRVALGIVRFRLLKINSWNGWSRNRGGQKPEMRTTQVFVPSLSGLHLPTTCPTRQHYCRQYGAEFHRPARFQTRFYAPRCYKLRQGTRLFYGWLHSRGCDVQKLHSAMFQTYKPTYSDTHSLSTAKVAWNDSYHSTTTWWKTSKHTGQATLKDGYCQVNTAGTFHHNEYLPSGVKSCPDHIACTNYATDMAPPRMRTRVTSWQFKHYSGISQYRQLSATYSVHNKLYEKQLRLLNHCIYGTKIATLRNHYSQANMPGIYPVASHYGTAGSTRIAGMAGGAGSVGIAGNYGTASMAGV